MRILLRPQSRFFGWLFLVLVAAVVLFFVYLPDYTKLKHLREENARLQSEINGLKSQISELSKNLKRINGDASLWERLAREQVGAVKKDEIVIDIRGEGE